MPDKRRHRGRHPDDDRLFAEVRLEALRTAVAEFSWLLTRGYAEPSALKLVGDRHGLTVRQRTAVMRCACSDAALAGRNAKRVTLEQVGDRPLGIDGYNLLITIESALSGGLILVGRDGCCRDLASVHGTYRKVAETAPAIKLIADYLTDRVDTRIDWYLDRPVSNSGRLKALMADVLERRGLATADVAEAPADAAGGPIWNIELVRSPDAVLVDYPGPIVTTDSAVLDRAGAWINLAADIIRDRCRTAWLVDLR
ncbi:MAG: DUF434 domain-containing protein [bacterium]|nr:DUF434 domain-containing protein [bacterium]